jgi:hypothetical protein
MPAVYLRKACAVNQHSAGRNKEAGRERAAVARCLAWGIHRSRPSDLVAGRVPRGALRSLFVTKRIAADTKDAALLPLGVFQICRRLE